LQMAGGRSWIKYIDRSQEQIVESIKSRNDLLPEITDHNESDPFIEFINIWAGMMEMLGIYVDNSARETFLSSARNFSSLVHIARLFDYRIKGVIPATCKVIFYLNNPASSSVVIPEGTEVRTNQGVPFFTLTSVTIPAGETSAETEARQQVNVAEVIGTTNGLPSQQITVGRRVVDNKIAITIGGINYDPVDTFAFSSFQDTHFVAGLNGEGLMSVQFGDGLNSRIPPSGSEVAASYYLSEGAAGNVAPGTITEIVSSVSLPAGLVLRVRNDVRAVGGVDAESIETLRRRLPLSLRTKERAVNRQDYEDIAVLYPGVARAGVDFKCGKTVDVYIAPEGGGIATDTLLEEVESWFEDKRMITTKVRFLRAGEVRIRLLVNIRVLRNYARETVRQKVLLNLKDFISVRQQQIRGTIFRNDIIEVIERTEGVDNSDLVLLTTVPYARPLTRIDELLWEREVLPTSTETVKWKISFYETGAFQLFRNNTFINNFQVGVQIQLTELRFKVLTTNQLGDSWEFWTYPYNDFSRVTLQEPSVPLAFDEDLTINASGGI
jgi:uncharacterized phage protein gp47/JayE